MLINSYAFWICKKKFKVLEDIKNVPFCECSVGFYCFVLAALAVAHHQCTSGITWISSTFLFKLREVTAVQVSLSSVLGTALVIDKWQQKLCCGGQPKQLFRIEAKSPPSPISSLFPGSCGDKKNCKVVFSQQELRKRLTPLQYHVTQEKGTER